MAAIIQSNRGGRCGVCITEFVDGEPQYTHVGGEGHDGFHRPCLILILRANPTCPYDQTSINGDLSDLLTRTERIMQRIRPALENAALATIIQLGAEVAGRAGVAAVERVAVERVAGAIVEAAGVEAAGVATAGIAVGVAAAIAIAIGIGIAVVVEAAPTVGRLLRAAGPTSLENIFGGVLLGTITPFSLMVFNLTSVPPSIPVQLLSSGVVAGIAAGALSLIR